MRTRSRLAAAAATITAPSPFHAQPGLASSGLATISASTVAATAARADSLVTVPAAAAVMTAPTPAQNQAPPWISGYTDTDARTTAMAAVIVSLGFIGRLPAVLPAVWPCGSPQALPCRVDVGPSAFRGLLRDGARACQRSAEAAPGRAAPGLTGRDDDADHC